MTSENRDYALGAGYLGILLGILMGAAMTPNRVEVPLPPVVQQVSMPTGPTVSLPVVVERVVLVESQPTPHPIQCAAYPQ